MKELGIIVAVVLVGCGAVYGAVIALRCTEAYGEQHTQICEEIAYAGRFRTRDGTLWIVSRAPER